jgi:hypothetical protein
VIQSLFLLRLPGHGPVQFTGNSRCLARYTPPVASKSAPELAGKVPSLGPSVLPAAKRCDHSAICELIRGDCSAIAIHCFGV